MRRQHKRKEDTPKDARDEFLKQLMLRASDDRKQTHDELVQLTLQINSLIRKEQRVAPAYQRRFHDEDPRSVFYYRMLRRIGLPDVHARFAPWFLKSHQIQLNCWSAVLFARLEQAYYARPEALSSLEVRMREHLTQYDAIRKSKAAGCAARSPTATGTMQPIEPRQQNQRMLARAFRDCSFHQDDSVRHRANKNNNQAKQHQRATLAAIQDDDARAIAQLELIPFVPVAPAPPGLAPQVPGQLESLGKHVFFTYSGRWRNGEMHGPRGTYTFSDTGKYTGEWVASQPSGAGTTVYPNGVTYTGSFVAGKFDGVGMLEYVPPLQPRDSVAVGSTTASNTSGGGFRYEGAFKRGMRCGRGKLLMLQTGAVYDGAFVDNQRHGNGVETNALGYSYSGEWANNRIRGPGTLTCPDGHAAFKAQWPHCMLGEAARLVKRERADAAQQQEHWYRQLLRVRDDLRALDLQYKHWDNEAARLQTDANARIERLKKARREKRDAQAAAKHAFMEQTATAAGHQDDESVSESEESEEEESEEGESEGEEEEDEGGD